MGDCNQDAAANRSDPYDIRRIFRPRRFPTTTTRPKVVSCTRTTSPSSQPTHPTHANNLLNYPLVTAADSQSGAVTWTLSGLALTDYRLEFYASTICPGGIGVGQRYLGSTVTATDGKGDAAGTTTTATSPVAGDLITMTATRRTFTGAGPFPTPLSFILNETSEFSPCQVAE